MFADGVAKKLAVFDRCFEHIADFGDILHGLFRPGDLFGTKLRRVCGGLIAVFCAATVE